MFRRKVEPLSDILNKFLRDEGIETPLLQRRVINSWDEVVGKTVVRYTGEKYIKGQTLYVKIINPALRQDLTIMRSQIVKRLNQKVGSFVISDIRIY